VGVVKGSLVRRFFFFCWLLREMRWREGSVGKPGVFYSLLGVYIMLDGWVLDLRLWVGICIAGYFCSKY